MKSNDKTCCADVLHKYVLNLHHGKTNRTKREKHLPIFEGKF